MATQQSMIKMRSSDPPKAISPASSKAITRRDFLSLAWKGLLGLSGALGLAGLWRFLSYQPYPAPVTVFDLGIVKQLPVGAIVTIPEAQAALINTAGSLQAVSLVCPHLGCTVKANESGFACPCHGSKFHPDGSLERGPATKGLRVLKLQVREDGHLILDTSEN
jgi:cytochrome b6-f complex iron-sulfur subunit